MIGHHETTTAHDENGTFIVTHHQTQIVKATATTITLNNGGWKTVTTKRRMNQALEHLAQRSYVFQKDYAWFVDTPHGVVEFDGDSVEIARV